MIIMPANNTHWLVHYLAGRFPGQLGQLYTPARLDAPKPHLPYGLDNGCYGRAKAGLGLDDIAWQKALEKYTTHEFKPRWIVVPDVPFDAHATLDHWDMHAPALKELGIPLALAVQNGMYKEHVEGLAVRPDVIFVGGTTEWKWQTVPAWCKAFPRVHIARCNGKAGLQAAHAAGAESVDGSGWFRGDHKQLQGLVEFLAEVNGLSAQDREQLVYWVRCNKYSARHQTAFTFEQEAS